MGQFRIVRMQLTYIIFDIACWQPTKVNSSKKCPHDLVFFIWQMPYIVEGIQHRRMYSN